MCQVQRSQDILAGGLQTTGACVEGLEEKAVISHLAMDQKPGSLVNIKLYVCIYGNDI